jgi:mono/diheme cytochrome c family protein
VSGPLSPSSIESGRSPEGSSEPPDTVAVAAAVAVVEAPAQRTARGLVTALMLAAATACIIVVLLVLPAARRDPYTRQTLELQGSVEHGALLFRLNCAGCHGIAAQGLVGPDLHGVAQRKTPTQIVQQVVSGRTPPMPRFQPDPQAMADLLAYLNGLV